MTDFVLQKKLRELCALECTLLWLEGSKTERVNSLRVRSGRALVLSLANDTTRVVVFERYAITQVGMQFWSQGRAGVLYRWEQVPASHWTLPESDESVDLESAGGPNPDKAA